MKNSKIATAGARFSGGVSFISGVITCWNWVAILIRERSIQAVVTSVWFYLSIVLLLVAFLCFYFLRKINAQKREIERLIDETNKQRNESIVSQLHGHPLVFTHLKYQLSQFYVNNVNLSLFSIKNTIESNKDERKDSTVTMELEGIFTAPSYCFRFVITGQSVVRAEDLNMEAFDMVKNERLLLETDNIGSKNDVREFRISYKNRKKPNEPLHIQVRWKWPRMMELHDDYIMLPNFFSSHTSAIRMILEKVKNRIFLLYPFINMRRP